MVEVSTDCPDGVVPSRMVSVSASVNLPLHNKVQKFSSGTGSPGWSRKKGRKTVVVVVIHLYCVYNLLLILHCIVEVALSADNLHCPSVCVQHLSAFLVHDQVTIIFVVSVCLFVCAEFFSAVFDPISIKLGHMLYVWV